MVQSFQLAAQPRITGKVVDAATGNPISGASIFISNTTYGTSSLANGTFSITNVPWGTYDLVVRSIGYETYAVEFIHSATRPTHLEVMLTVKQTLLDEVVIIPFDKDGWERWGRLFLETFLGTSPNAARAKLVNQDALRFRYHKSEGYLEVIALEPLRIENRSLGYTLEYVFGECRIDFRNRTSLLYGYPHFQEMQAGRMRKRRYERRREETYGSSLMRFVRSLYRGSLHDDGYEVRRMERKPNVEKQRVVAIRRNLYQTIWDSTRRVHVSKLMPAEQYTADSLAYFERISSEPDEIVTIFPQLLSEDGLLWEDVQGRKVLAFDDFLHVRNTRLQEHPTYLEYQRELRNPDVQTSMLSLVDGGSVQIESNGSYFPPQLVFTGWYWAWCDKLADLLPLDYKPPSDE